MNSISLTLKEYNRNTTKSQYKASRHWLRSVAKQIEPEVMSKANKAMHDLMVYGVSVI